MGRPTELTGQLTSQMGRAERSGNLAHDEPAG